MGLENGNRIGIDHDITLERIKAPFVSRELSSIPTIRETLVFKESESEGLPEEERDLRHVEPEKNNEKHSSSPDGFEPFENPFQDPESLFVNAYNGNYFREMTLNRKAVERVLKIAHLDGKVVLISLDPSRKRTVETNSDGSITAKRSLLFGQKIEDEGKEPLYKVESVPQGWNIEINDKRMVEELSEKGLKGEELKKEFVKNFNGFVNQGVFESVGREKLSSEKDENFNTKLLLSLLYHGPVLSSLTVTLALNKAFFWNVVVYSLPYVFISALPNAASRGGDYGRKLDNPLEYFAPRVEIDKVARSFVFLKGKGRNLVRERDPEASG